MDACQATIVHGSRTISLNDIEFKGSYLKATVCKSNATNAVRAAAEGLALWPAPGVCSLNILSLGGVLTDLLICMAGQGRCTVKKVIYKIDEMVVILALSCS